MSHLTTIKNDKLKSFSVKSELDKLPGLDINAMLEGQYKC